MRKLILTAALVLISVSAQAGETRGLIMASAEAPKPTVSEQIKALGPETPAIRTAEAKTETSAAPKQEAKPEADAQTRADTKPQPKPVTKKRETDEQKARRIAARYGISW